MKAANDNGKHPSAIPPLSVSERATFWLAVDQSRGADSCWPWTGIAEPYGRVKIRGRVYLSHRVAYAIHTNNDLQTCPVVRHSCDNPPCCNPAHLSPGSYADNTADMLSRDRSNPRKGEAHSRSVANDNLIREILDSPLSGRKAALHFGVSYGLVANIRSGRSWKHIERPKEEAAA